MHLRNYASKVGVYVDASNVYRCGGRRMQYDVLRDFAGCDGAQIVRLNAYVSYDRRRAERDSDYFDRSNKFYARLRDYGYKVIIKEVKWFTDEDGSRYAKADADLDLAVDVLLQSDHLDRILLVTGDSDFARVVSAVQNKGCRVEIIALDHASFDLRREADLFTSGFLIPNLVALSDRESSDTNPPKWGEVSSRVRGVCYHHNELKGFGFFRYLKELAPNVWQTDTQHPDTPYGTAFFHDSNLPDGIETGRLPNYNHIFEFDLLASPRRLGTYEAANIQLISRIPG
jgi:uncharacterized LabA/DUF88 family protein